MNKPNSKSKRFSSEVRERAVPMVQEHRGDYASVWTAIESIAPKIGCVPQPLHEWVRKQEIDTGMREASPAKRATASKPWNVKSRNCAEPIKS